MVTLLSGNFAAIVAELVTNLQRILIVTHLVIVTHFVIVTHLLIVTPLVIVTVLLIVTHLVLLPYHGNIQNGCYCRAMVTLLHGNLMDIVAELVTNL